MTVREAQTRMDAREFAEWLAYERLTGPLGGERGDLHTAIVAATVHNLWAKRPRKLRDFMPQWAQKRQTVDEQLALVKAMNRAFGGTVEGEDA